MTKCIEKEKRKDGSYHVIYNYEFLDDNDEEDGKEEDDNDDSSDKKKDPSEE